MTLFEFYLEQAWNIRHEAERHLRFAIEDDLGSYLHFIREFGGEALTEWELEAAWEWIERRQREVEEEVTAAYTEKINRRGRAHDGTDFVIWRSHRYYYHSGRFPLPKEGSRSNRENLRNED